MCENCEVIGLIGTCMCETFCFCCAESVDEKLRQREIERKRKKRRGKYTNEIEATTNNSPIISQPKNSNKSDSSIEMQLLKTAEKHSDDNLYSEALKQTLDQPQKRL